MKGFQVSILGRKKIKLTRFKDLIIFPKHPLISAALLLLMHMISGE